MRDPELERNLSDTKELHSRWSQFHDFFNMALKGGKPTPEAETKFLDLKTRIAMLHDGFMRSLTHDQKVGQNVLQILGQCIFLRRIPKLGNAEIQKLEFDWNEAYLLMTETVANLEDEQQRIAGISQNAYRLRQTQEKITTVLHNFFVGPWFKVIAVVGVLFFVIVGVPLFGIYDYMNLKQQFPKVAPVYDYMTNVARKMNPNLRFIDIQDVTQEDPSEETYIKDTVGLRNVTKEYAFTQLPNLSFDPKEDLKPDGELKAIWDRSVGFNAEIRKLADPKAQRLVAYYILFKTTADAKRFVEIRRKAVDKRGREAADKDRQSVNVARKANFVAIFASGEPKLRIDFAKAKYKFKDNEINL